MGNAFAEPRLVAGFNPSRHMFQQPRQPLRTRTLQLHLGPTQAVFDIVAETPEFPTILNLLA